MLSVLLVPLAAQGDDKFSLKATFEPASAAPGDTIKLVLRATTAPGWHAYGTLETTNIPIALAAENLTLNGLGLAGAAQVPPGNPHATPIGTSYPLPESFQVVQSLKVPAGASGKIEVTGVLDYQICDESMCERPNQAAFSATLQIGTAPAGATSAQDPVKTPELGTKPPLMLDPDGLQADGKVSITARFDPKSVRAGETTTLILHVQVAEGWHAYGAFETSNVPVGYDELQQDTGDLEFVGEALVPDGEEKETPIGPSYPLPHEFEVKQVFRVPAGTKPGEIEVAGVLDYQICDENGCDPQAEGEYEAKLVVEAGETRAEKAAVPEITAPKDDDDNPFTSWWALIIASIGGGLFALAMPCTYPMIPITFSFFTKQAEARGGKVLPLTIAYGLGIIAMFVGVGVALSAVIIDVVNHWATNAIIGFMFVFFAFVLFGWINLTPPQWMQRMAYKAQTSASQSSSQSGVGLVAALLGVFFMGATLVITSFTCTAPIVGSLIANVAKLGTLRVAIGMAIFGLTMAIPFMFLSLAPNKVKSMPKSGEWMQTLKVSLGFVELAAAWKFVSMVDTHFGWQILPREVFLALISLTLGAWAVYLFRILGKAGAAHLGVSTGRKSTGIAVSLVVVYFLYGAAGNRLDPLMTAFVPAYSLFEVKAEHTVVKDDPDAALARAKADDKLLLYNFTGFN